MRTGCFRKVDSYNEEFLVIHIGGIYIKIEGISKKEISDSFKNICPIGKNSSRMKVSQVLKVIFVDKRHNISEDVGFNFDFLLDRFPFDKKLVREINNTSKKWGAIISKINRESIVYPQDDSLFLFDPGNREAFLFLNESIDDGLIFFNILEGLKILLSSSAPDFNGIFLHACGIVKDEGGYIFLGFPNSGKTTIAEFSQKEALVLSDDGIILRKCGNRYKIFGTPYTEIISDDLSMGYPLKKMFFIHKYGNTYTEPLSPAKASALILLHYIPYFRFFPLKSARKVFNLITRICRETPAYTLYFNKTKEFFGVI
jgi:hypothetical protein